MEQPHIDRLLYLYSEANAEEPDVVSFWEEKIYQSCLKHGTFRFTAQALLHEFTVNDVYPSSFIPVLSTLKSKGGRIVPADHLLSGEVDILQSIFSRLWSGPPDPSKQIHIPSKLLSDAQDCLLSLVATLEDRVVFVKSSSHHPPLYSFRGILAHATGTKKNDTITQLLNSANEEDSDLLLRYMIKNGRAVLSTDGEMVKFIIANKPGQANGFSLFNFIGINDKAEPADTISEAEEASLRLKSSIHLVETKVEELRVSAGQLLDKARKCKVIAAYSFVAFPLPVRTDYLLTVCIMLYFCVVGGERYERRIVLLVQQAQQRASEGPVNSIAGWPCRGTRCKLFIMSI